MLEIEVGEEAGEDVLGEELTKFEHHLVHHSLYTRGQKGIGKVSYQEWDEFLHLP